MRADATHALTHFFSIRVTALPVVVAGNYFGYIDFAPYATLILMAWIAVFLGTVATMFKIRRLAMEVS